MVRQPDATMQPTPQDDQLMSKHRVLSFKPHLRLEWRCQHGQSEAEQPNHHASLDDSSAASHSDEVFGTHNLVGFAGPRTRRDVDRLGGRALFSHVRHPAQEIGKLLPAHVGAQGVDDVLDRLELSKLVRGADNGVLIPRRNTLSLQQVTSIDTECFG
jgi:hypothetical protein